MAELKTRLAHLDEALTTGHLTLNTTLSTDTVRVWETSDRHTRLTLQAVDSIGRIIARAWTKYDGRPHEWLLFRHWEHGAIARVLEALGFVETPEDEQDGPSMADVMDEIESIGSAPAGGAPSVERLAEILWTGRKKALDLADIPLRDLDLHVQEQYVRYAAAVAEQLGQDRDAEMERLRAAVKAAEDGWERDVKRRRDKLDEARTERARAVAEVARLATDRDRTRAALADADKLAAGLRGELADLAAQNAKTESNFEEFAEVIIPERDRYRLAYESARRGRRAARALNRELATSYETTLRIVQNERDEARRRIALALTTAAELHEFNSPDGDHLDGCPGCRIEAELNGGAR